jgi:hypothetical protein
MDFSENGERGKASPRIMSAQLLQPERGGSLMAYLLASLHSVASARDEWSHFIDLCQLLGSGACGAR